MATKAMWEVDPETRTKLLSIQKQNQNNLCCDCNAPSPQWASPKFGIFICLTCAGVHRGLGVHISFVRSISMDAFKAVELERMRAGGNGRWKDFFRAHEDTRMRGPDWDDATIAERYSGSVGEEWKERLTCLVDGREYLKDESKPSEERKGPTPASDSRTSSPSRAAAGGGSGAKFKVDDTYFARLAADNTARPADLPPSQGGKYSGFGNSPGPARNDSGTGMPTYEDLQKDPMAVLSKGFGWLTRTAKNVNDGYIQPAAAKIAESDIAKSAHDGFNRFVEGPNGNGSGGRAARNSSNSGREPMEEGHRQFWDDFSAMADRRTEEASAKPSAIGTSAIGKTGSGGSVVAPPPLLPGKKAGDEWDDW